MQCCLSRASGLAPESRNKSSVNPAKANPAPTPTPHPHPLTPAPAPSITSNTCAQW